MCFVLTNNIFSEQMCSFTNETITHSQSSLIKCREAIRFRTILHFDNDDDKNDADDKANLH